MDGILKNITDKRYKAVAYADDVTILVIVKFPVNLSELTGSALREIDSQLGIWTSDKSD